MGIVITIMVGIIHPKHPDFIGLFCDVLDMFAVLDNLLEVGEIFEALLSCEDILYFLWRPCLVVGIPVARAILIFAPVIPVALFQEKEVPNFLPT